eukprot:scaffold11574_cov51-Phaeocystis_antarctica.AAC.1
MSHTVELVPAIGPVVCAAVAEKLHRHLDHEDERDDLRDDRGGVLELHGVLLRLPGVRHAHEHHVEQHEPGGAVAEPRRVDHRVQRSSAARRPGQAVAAALLRPLLLGRAFLHGGGCGARPVPVPPSHLLLDQRHLRVGQLHPNHELVPAAVGIRVARHAVRAEQRRIGEVGQLPIQRGAGQHRHRRSLVNVHRHGVQRIPLDVHAGRATAGGGVCRPTTLGGCVLRVIARAEDLVPTLLLLVDRGVHGLRLDELLQDDGEEEVDHEEATEYDDEPEEDERGRIEGRHQSVHGEGPRVEGDGLHDRDEGHRHRVEGGDVVRGILVKIRAELAGGAAAPADRAEPQRVVIRRSAGIIEQVARREHLAATLVAAAALEATPPLSQRAACRRDARRAERVRGELGDLADLADLSNLAQAPALDGVVLNAVGPQNNGDGGVAGGGVAVGHCQCHAITVSEEAGMLLEAVEGAAVVHRAFEELHADDAEDEEDEAAQRRDVAHLREGRHDGGDQHWHAGHALEGPQRPQRAHRSDDGVVSKRGDEDGQPSQGDHRDVELAPGVCEVGVGVAAPNEAVRDDLGEHLDGEDD